MVPGHGILFLSEIFSTQIIYYVSVCAVFSAGACIPSAEPHIISATPSVLVLCPPTDAIAAHLCTIAILASTQQLLKGHLVQLVCVHHAIVDAYAELDFLAVLEQIYLEGIFEF